jgi:tRNA (guanine37-N1)-methyltransferase
VSLKDELRGAIPDDILDKVPNRFSIIGDIALISIPPEINSFGKEIADAVISKHVNIKTVLCKISKLEGDRRIAGFKILAGQETVTTCREFGHLYRLDLLKVFFNSRLGYERRRIASLVGPGEDVFIPFCGVGPFAVPIAAAGARVVALENNIDACLWLSENARLNRVEDRIDIIKGDAFRAFRMFKGNFDRIVIPTPYGRDEILESLIPLLRDGGMAHFYTFKKRYQIEGKLEEYQSIGLKVILHRRCGNVAPGVSRWVFDLIKDSNLKK